VLAGLQIQQQPPHWQTQTLSAVTTINTRNIMFKGETIPVFTSQGEDCQHSKSDGTLYKHSTLRRECVLVLST
jgi:hypothetical protein